MTQKTAVQDAAGSRLDAAWLYDAIMREIEPELLPGALAGLEGKYAGETREEQELRMQRYQAAFDAFDAALQSLDEHLVSEARELRAAQQRRSRESEWEESQEELGQIERRIRDAG